MRKAGSQRDSRQKAGSSLWWKSSFGPFPQTPNHLPCLKSPYNALLKGTDSRNQTPWFLILWARLLAMWPWTYILTFLFLNFIIFKIGIIIVHTSWGCAVHPSAPQEETEHSNLDNPEDLTKELFTEECGECIKSTREGAAPQASDSGCHYHT